MKPAQLVTAVALLASPAAFADSKAWTTGRVMIPETATIVGGISAASLRASGLYQQFLPLLLSQAGQFKTGVETFQKACNIDLLGSIDSGAVGVDDSGVGTIVISLKGTTHKALDACAQKLAKADSKELAITTEGKFTKYAGTAMGDKAIYVAWLSAETFAVSTSPDDKDASTRLLTSGVDKSTDLKRGLAGVNKNASVWLVGRKDTPLPDVGGKMTAFYVSANVANKKIDATAHLVTDSEKTATALTADARKKLATALTSNSNLKATLATVTFSNAGSEVIGSGSIAEDDVIALLMMLKH
jgi:hypothetical protein